MPLRLRIALSTAALMAVSLLILGGGVYITLSRSLDSSVESRLRSVYQSYLQNPGRWTLSPGQWTLETSLDAPASAGAYIQLSPSDGDVVKKSDNLGRFEIPAPEIAADDGRRPSTVYYRGSINGVPIQVLSGPLHTPTGQIAGYVQVAEPLSTVNRTLDALKRTLLVGSILATVVLSVGAWIIGDAALEPLSRMTQTARQIGSTRDLSRRIDPPRTNDEVQDLAETFNDMLARLEESFDAQRRFVADASHELRTPLTALRANSEIMLRQIDSGMLDRAELTEGLTDVRDEVDRMTRLVQNLLTLARADVGWRPEMEAVDLADVARDAARVALPLARGHELTFDAPPLPDGRRVEVFGNADQIRQLILILLDNAFTYTPRGTRVRLDIGIDHGDEHGTIRVTDSGPGISPEHRRRIFERFYRADDARTSASGGAGLGLSIARWIVTIHDGVIDVESNPGSGATFTVRLPLMDDTHGAGSRPMARGSLLGTGG